MLEEFENECERRRNRRECCIGVIDLFLFFLTVIIAFLIGLILGAIFHVAVLIFLPIIVFILVIFIFLIFTRIFVLLCCRRN